MPPNRSPSRALAAVAAAALLAPVVFLLLHLRLPLYEDGLFWWVPRALWLVEQGPSWVAAGDLPTACDAAMPLPPQWTGGLPDYGHPPLWFHYLALWMRLLGSHAWVVHASCLPVAAAIGWGALALCRRLAGPASAPLALVALLAPPLLGQLLRPDTDLPLLAACLWALVALADGKPWRFAAIAVLAVWLKEPAVLLAVPALVVALAERRTRFLLASLAAPIALAAWALVHLQVTGWALSGAEHLPASPTAYLGDLAAVTWLTVGATGRWLGWCALSLSGLAWLLNRPASGPTPPSSVRARRAALAMASFVAVQLLFFGGLNFLGGRDLQDAYTHVRYLLPALSVGTLLAVGLTFRGLLAALPTCRRLPLATAAALSLPLMAATLPSVRTLHPRGPEANLYGRDQARAWMEAARAITEGTDTQGRVWVESHLYTALTRPYAGLVSSPIPDLEPYGPATRPDHLTPGDLILYANYGEPLGRLGELVLDPVATFTTGSAWVKLARVRPGRSAPPPMQGGQQSGNENQAER